MKSIIRSLLVVAGLGFASQSHAVSCDVVRADYEKACYVAPNPSFKTELKMWYADGKLFGACTIVWSDGKRETTTSSAACDNGNTNPTPTPTPPPAEPIAKTLTTPFVDNVICKQGSIILVDSQVLGETVPVVGTNFEMAYFSNKVVGRLGDYRMQIPLTSSIVDPKFTHVKYKIIVDGIVLETKTLDIAKNLIIPFVWNGLVPGRTVNGSGQTQIVYEYLPGGSLKAFVLPVGNLPAKILGFGGWIPTNYHFYDKARNQVLRGDGSSLKMRAERMPNNELRVVDTERSKVYIFDASTGRHLLTKTFWLGTDLLSFKHDANGLLQAIEEPFGKRTLFNRNDVGDLISITSPTGQVTQVSLDANKYISSITNTAGQTYTMTYYDANGLLKTFKKPQGQISTFNYDNLGNLISDAHSGGYSLKLEKTVQGQNSVIASITQMGRRSVLANKTLEDTTYWQTQISPDDRKTINQSNFFEDYVESGSIIFFTSYQYDKRFKDYARTVEYSLASGTTTIKKKVVRDENFELSDSTNPFSIKNYLLTITDNVGGRSLTSYSGDSKTFTTTDRAGISTVYKIDEYERPIFYKLGKDLAVNAEYSNDKLIRIAQGDRTLNFTYDQVSNNLATVTNALGQSTIYSYDQLNRLISTEYPDGKKVILNYNENGKVIGITPAEKPKHNFLFNALELIFSYSPPTIGDNLPTNTVYAYNADKQLLSVAKPDGKKIAFNYDPAKGVLKSISTPEGVYSYTYNSIHGAYEKILTPANIETEKLRTDGGFVTHDFLWKDGKVISAYKKVPNLFGMVNYDSVAGNTPKFEPYIKYLYGAELKLLQVGDQKISYDIDSGRINGTRMTSGASTISDAYSYNAHGELSSYVAKQNEQTVYSYELSYDLLGRIFKKVETVKGASKIFDYLYDSRNRLSEVKQNGVIISKYNYDGNNNRSSGIVSGQNISASYDSQDRLVIYNADSFQHTLNGELLSKRNNVSNQITPVAFNSFGQMTSVKVGSLAVEYHYDGEGRRVLNFLNGKMKSLYIYKDQIRLAGIAGPDGLVHQQFGYSTKFQVPDIIIMKGATYRIISDNLGSVRLVIRVKDGSIVQEMLHDEFGKVVKDTNPGFQPFGFAGGLYDQSSNLIQFGARWYNPEVGRWISKDPIKFGGGNNFYEYASSDPINFIDIDGHKPFAPSIGEGGLSAGGGGAIILPAVQAIVNALSTRKLSPWEIDNLTDNTGDHPHDIKDGLKPSPSSWDIYVEEDGKLSLRDKKGKNPIPLDYDIEDTKRKKGNRCEE